MSVAFYTETSSRITFCLDRRGTVKIADFGLNSIYSIK